MHEHVTGNYLGPNPSPVMNKKGPLPVSQVSHNPADLRRHMPQKAGNRRRSAHFCTTCNASGMAPAPEYAVSGACGSRGFPGKTGKPSPPAPAACFLQMPVYAWKRKSWKPDARGDGGEERKRVPRAFFCPRKLFLSSRSPEYQRWRGGITCGRCGTLLTGSILQRARKRATSKCGAALFQLLYQK